jgi:translocation and assembly module TamA
VGVRIPIGVTLYLLAGLACTSSSWKNEGAERKVRRVGVEGNRAFGDKRIVSKLATHPPTGLIRKTPVPFDPLLVEVDEKRVEQFYREHGYFSAEVTRVATNAVGRQDMDVTFHVREGKPTRIASLRLSGTPPELRRNEIDELLGLEPGEVFKHPRYAEAKLRLEARLGQKGYAHARVHGRVEIDRERRDASVDVRLDPGPRARFGRTLIAGLGRIPKETVLRRVAWDEGDTYDPAKLERTQGELLQLGYFAMARIDVEHEGRPETVDVTIHVAEAQRHEVRLGGGVLLDRSRLEVRGRAGYVVKSWLDPLLTLRLDARPGYVVLPGRDAITGFTGEASATLEKIDLLDVPRLRGESMVGWDFDVFEAYRTMGPEARLTLDRPFFESERLRLGVGWDIRRLTITADDPAIADELGIVDPYRLAYYEQTFTWDGRDNLLDPHRGGYARLALEEGGPWAGGAFEYARVTPELRGYVPLGKRLVLAARSRGGWLGPLGGDETTPLTQRFFGGGSSGHRGFAYRRLSPMLMGTDGRQIPVGGNAHFLATGEVRVDVARVRKSWLGVVGFVDAGDVTPEVADLQMQNLHYATGIGLRYDTIVGPLRLDLGYRLNRVDEMDSPDRGRRFAFHFSLGEAF